MQIWKACLNISTCKFSCPKLTWQWKIHHECRCLSYWTWEFSNVMLVFRGVNIIFFSIPCFLEVDMTETETVVAAGTVDQGGDLEIRVGWIGWSSVEPRGIALKGALLKKWQNIRKFQEIYWKYHESMNIVDGVLLLGRGDCFVDFLCCIEWKQMLKYSMMKASVHLLFLRSGFILHDGSY